MKKLFISCPMKGRTKENINKSLEKMHKIAEIIFEQELEVIPNYITEDYTNFDKAKRVRCLGTDISRLAVADYFIGIEDYSYNDFYADTIVHIALNDKIPGTTIKAIDAMSNDELKEQDISRQFGCNYYIPINGNNAE